MINRFGKKVLLISRKNLICAYHFSSTFYFLIRNIFKTHKFSNKNFLPRFFINQFKINIARLESGGCLVSWTGRWGKVRAQLEKRLSEKKTIGDIFTSNQRRSLLKMAFRPKVLGNDYEWN